MDNRKRIPADTPRRKFQLFPRFGMAERFKPFRLAAHVALGFNFSGVFLQHVTPECLLSQRQRSARQPPPPLHSQKQGRR